MRFSFRRLFSGYVGLLTLLNVALFQTMAQERFSPANGLRQNTPRVVAFTNARIVQAPGRVIDKGTLLIREGVIEAVGAAVKIPSDAMVIDLSGKMIYPGLIESYSSYGMPEPPRGPQAEVRGTKYWSDKVFSSTKALEQFKQDSAWAQKYRAMGFTATLSVPKRGILKGESALFSLGDDSPNALVIERSVAQHFSLDVDFFSRGYPNSLMGVIALLRQTFYDAKWHQEALKVPAKGIPVSQRPEFISELDALSPAVSGKMPTMVETTDELSLFRAAVLAKEFGLKLWALGSGYEYRRLSEVKKTAIPLVLSVNFPSAPEVQSAAEANQVSFADLEHWALAASNPKRLLDAGISFSLSGYGLRDPAQLFPQVRKALDHGLSDDAALAAFTTIPAKLFGVDSKLGSLEAGKHASFSITDGALFSEKTKVLATWIDGNEYVIKEESPVDFRGLWSLSSSNTSLAKLSLDVTGESTAPKASISVGSKRESATVQLSGGRLLFFFNGDSLGLPGTHQFTAVLSEGGLFGTATLASGEHASWAAILKTAFTAKPDTSKKKPSAPLPSFTLLYPQGEFGVPKQPELPSVLFIKNATIWTSGKQGKLENADMLVQAGKIIQVGKNLKVPQNAVVIDATGKHITPGLIDCHSHTAIAGGVNEVGQAITAEVRVGDVVDSDDIGIYRELAGGLTAANLLHGSANAIGGQNQVIKLRWGALPEEMKFEGAISGIKFALGENPKRVNAQGAGGNTRYPFTRQGIEQLIRDEFKAAQDYERKWKEFTSGKSKVMPRRDLELDAIVEILNKKRLIHSHSYKQDEIIMLIRVADDFGFQIGTFQHVLEGYKAASELARHGAGASAFSDWWAYKFEVYDAIPFAGAIMHNAGVTVSFNSDSDELARRMNTEAAKAVKYGGVSEEEALKFVTLNPAKQLRIDNRVGSLEAGKDADFVIWSGNPLSTYTHCEQTWIDGRKYFDRALDRTMNQELQAKRTALIQRLLSEAKEAATPSAGAPPRRPRHFTIKDMYNCQCHDSALLYKETAGGE
ncbi:MAG: amidohydrolase family protein [Chloroherpetonaceae bacterium]|nr:amidohydrolase family protein [Chloroherpetonaceae bacterium]